MIRVPLFLLILLGAAAIAEAGAQSRRHEEETVRGLDDRERIAALNRDVPALETFPEEVNAPSAR